MKRTLLTLAFALSTAVAGIGADRAGLLDTPAAAAQTVAQAPAAVAPALTPAAPVAAPATAQTFTCTAPAAVEPATPAPPAPAPAREGLVNVNTATEAELVALDGIGTATAKRIAKMREAGHRFTSVDELAALPGVTSVNFAKFRGEVTV